jgi:mannose/fructose/sorbose-specific phosphotransferase system IIB component
VDIVLARIDERLIHGQVAINWSRYSKCERIIVCSDEVIKDELRSTLLVKAVPPGLKANIVDLEKGVKVYENPKYSEMKVMFLFQNPHDLLRFVEMGVDIKVVNVGGMPYREGKKLITKSVGVDEHDIATFRKLHGRGMKLEIRTLPTDTIIDLAEKLGF